MPSSHFLDRVRCFLGKHRKGNDGMGGRTRIYQLLIFSSILFLLTLISGGIVSADANNDDASSDVLENVKSAIADKEAIRERLAKTFTIRAEWEKYGIPSKTPPVKPADKPEKPGAGVTPEEPPERPIGERGYEIILPPPKDGKEPVGMLPLPEEERALIRASPVPLPPTGRGVSPSIYGVLPPPSWIGAPTTIYGVSPPARPPSYYAVSTVRAPLYMKPTAAISPVAALPTTGKYPLYIPPAVSSGGFGGSSLMIGEGGIIGGETVGKTVVMAKQGIDVVEGIFTIIINNKYLIWTIVIIVFAAIIGKAAGWQVGMIGGAALGVALAVYSGPGGSLMPAFLTGIILLGFSGMIAMAISKMTAG